MKRGFYLTISIITLVIGSLLAMIVLSLIFLSTIIDGLRGGGSGSFFYEIFVLIIFLLPLTISILSLVSLKNTDPNNIFKRKRNIFYFMFNLLIIVLFILLILMPIIMILVNTFI
jgi:hypothetical protein